MKKHAPLFRLLSDLLVAPFLLDHFSSTLTTHSRCSIKVDTSGNRKMRGERETYLMVYLGHCKL